MRQDVGGWGVKLEALRLLAALATGFRKLLQPHLPAVLDATWALFTAALPVYQRAAVGGAEDLDEEVRPCACTGGPSLGMHLPAGHKSTGTMGTGCEVASLQVRMPVRSHVHSHVGALLLHGALPCGHNVRRNVMSLRCLPCLDRSKVLWHALRRMLKFGSACHAGPQTALRTHTCCSAPRTSRAGSQNAGFGLQRDSDGDTVDLEGLLSQAFEFLLTIAGSRRMAPTLERMLPELVRLSLGAPLLHHLVPLSSSPMHACSKSSAWPGRLCLPPNSKRATSSSCGQFRS